jgi:hypothetical protein
MRQVDVLPGSLAKQSSLPEAQQSGLPLLRLANRSQAVLLNIRSVSRCLKLLEEASGDAKRKQQS